jgi:hypothetical protein
MKMDQGQRAGVKIRSHVVALPWGQGDPAR